MPRIASASMPVAAAAASGVKSRASGSSASKPSLSSASRPGSRQPLLEDHVDEREQQVRVGAGADEVVLVGDLGGARAPRVDHHDLAAALLDRTQAPAHVGRREQAAVGGERVGAEDQQVVGAVDVRHRDRQRAAEHQRRGDLLRPLVDRARGVDVAGAERLGEHAAVEQRRHAVDGRVADVDRGAVAAVLGQQRRQALVDDARTPRPTSRGRTSRRAA